MRRKNDHPFSRLRGRLIRALAPVLLLLAGVPASAQVMSVGYQKKIEVPMAGAIAAYSLDSKCAEASVVAETLTLFGQNPCDTRVVVITDKGTETLDIHVVPAPPSYPPGFVPPETAATRGEMSSYEIRYLSDPGQLQDTFDSVFRQGNRSFHLHIANASLFSATPGLSRFSFPSLSYEISTPGMGITFFDQIVINSPLTVDGSLVRGFHLRAGRWTFHAGFASVAAFSNLLLPLEKEGVFGLGYRLPVTPHGSLTASLYSIYAKASANSVASPGQVATLAYRYEPSQHLNLLAEAGYSRGPAAALEFASARVGDELEGKVRYEPAKFASLGVNNFHGLFGDLHWDHQFSSKLSFDLGFAEDKYILPGFRQTDTASSVQFLYRPVRQWTLFSGGGYSRFVPSDSLSPKVTGLNFPVGTSFDTRHFGAGFQYQYSRNGAAHLGGQEFRASLRAGARRVYLSGYFDRQTQTPTLGYVLQQVPGLQQVMTELNLTATSPAEIVQALRKNVELQNMGYLSDLVIQLSPVRTQWGGSLNWSSTGRSHQQVRLGFLNDRIDAVPSSIQTTLGTVAYTRQIGLESDISVSISMFQTDSAGFPGGVHPLAEVTFRHRFHAAPSLLLPTRHGMVSGIVFLDQAATGVLQPGATPLAGVEVVLDDARRTETDRQGRYQFSHIPDGSHVVEVHFHSAKPFFYTTPSRAAAELNSEVNFGVTFSSARLFGVVRNDAGAPVAGVRITVASSKRMFEAETNSDGAFSLAGMDDGIYQARIEPDSLPPGYRLDILKPAQIRVSSEMPEKLAFKVEAMRSVAGKVTTFDVQAGRMVPMPGLTVRIPVLNRQCVTDANGNYLFRELAAGTYHISVEFHGKEYGRTITLGPNPVMRTGVDLEIEPAAVPARPAPQRAATLHAPEKP
jgi:hypothetical protein